MQLNPKKEINKSFLNEQDDVSRLNNALGKRITMSVPPT